MLALIFWWAFWSMLILFGMSFLGGFLTLLFSCLALIAWCFKWIRNFWEPYDRL